MYSRSLVAARGRPASRATTVGCAPLLPSLLTTTVVLLLVWASTLARSQQRRALSFPSAMVHCHLPLSVPSRTAVLPSRLSPVERAVFKGGHCPIGTQNYRWLLDGSVAVHGVAWPTDSAPALTLTTVVSTTSLRTCFTNHRYILSPF